MVAALPMQYQCLVTIMLTATVAAAYGTYVVFGTDIKCKVNDEVIWDPAKEVTVLVCLTWGFQVVSL